MGSLALDMRLSHRNVNAGGRSEKWVMTLKVAAVPGDGHLYRGRSLSSLGG